MAGGAGQVDESRDFLPSGEDAVGDEPAETVTMAVPGAVAPGEPTELEPSRGDRTVALENPGVPPRVEVPGYEVLGILGRGGMGVVYEARQRKLNRPCALKMILGGAHADADATARFLAEAEAVARLQHPNIVQIYHIGEVDGLPFVELEYVPGGGLDSALDGTPWPARRAAAMVEPLARAMVEAHRRGIVHRDLKPPNVLLTADGRPKITDFGLAKRLDVDSSQTRTGMVLGTPSYMAPEQAGGGRDAVGPAADVYALGAILYELLTGRPPFKAATPLETVMQVMAEEPLPPSRLVPGLPRDVETICLKCLQKDRAKRYEDAEALADDLRRFGVGEPIRARPVGPLERAWRWSRRNPAVASLAAALLLAVGGGLVGMTVLWLQALDKARSEEVARAAEETARGQAVAASRRSARGSARLALDRGQALGEQGEAGRALQWLAESLKLAPAEDRDLRRAARAGLAAWERRAPALLATFHSPGGPTLFAPDGTYIVSFRDGAAWLYDTRTGTRTRPAMSYPAEVTAAAFTTDGKALVTGCGDGSLHRWVIASVKPDVESRRLEGPVVALGPGAKVAATWPGRGPTVLLWDAQSGERLGAPIPHRGDLVTVAFSPDGKFAVVGGGYDFTARRYEVATGQPVGPPLRNRGWVLAAAFNPDGKTLLVGGGSFGEPEARLWDVADGRPIGPPLAHQHKVHAVAFSPDGTTSLTASADGTARLWDAATGERIGPSLPHPGSVLDATFDPEGTRVLTRCADGQARVWDVTEARPDDRPFAQRAAVRDFATAARATTIPGLAAAYSPDGKSVLTAGDDGAARLWDADSGRPIGPPMPHPRGVRAVAFSPDGRLAVTAGDDGTARAWDLAKGTLVGRPAQHAAFVMAVAFRPDGKAYLTGSSDGTARLWEAATGRPLGPPLSHLRPGSRVMTEVWNVAFSPDGKVVAVGDSEIRVRLWDPVSGKPLHPPWKDEGLAMAFRPDGKSLLLAGGSKPHARLWDVATGEPLGPPLPHQRPVRVVAFRGDGRAVLTGSEDNTARAWDPVTGEPLGPPLEHQNFVNVVGFSPDGMALLTASGDHTARLWDAATGKPLGPPLSHRDPVVVATFRPDGRAVLTASRTAQVWALPAPWEGADLRLALRAQARTALELGDDGMIRILPADTWRSRRDVLRRGDDPPSGETTGPGSGPDLLAWHDRNAAQCERDGLWFGARWHLGRLAAARPDDWLVHARRALACLELGDIDEATSEEERALAVGTKEKLLDWCDHQAYGAEGRRDWPPAAHYLDRLVADHPEAGGLRRRQAEALARLERWPEATAALAAAVDLGDDELTSHHHLALLRVRAGDLDGYRVACESLLRKAGPRPHPMVANAVAWDCVLGPGAVHDPEAPVKLAEQALAAFPPDQAPAILNSLGAALHRAGRHDEAIRRLEEGIERGGGEGSPQDWAFLALARLAKGDRAAARPWIDRLARRPTSSGPDQFWDDLEIGLFLREVDAADARTPRP
ncbi:MAG TPA: protein kinase [Isosphaeraceae bacterium]|nr:protein kinase [Isosphaeraceae bacterium]